MINKGWCRGYDCFYIMKLCIWGLVVFICVMFFYGFDFNKYLFMGNKNLYMLIDMFKFGFLII